MRVELPVTVRGERRELAWQDGSLSGDVEVVHRLRLGDPAGDLLYANVVDAIGAIEAATAQRVTFTVVESETQHQRTPVISPDEGDGDAA